MSCLGLLQSPLYLLQFAVTTDKPCQPAPCGSHLQTRAQGACSQHFVDGQWLFYRSLGPAGNRTVLGQNIAGEFTAGRFPSSGKFKQWIEIEAV